MTPTTPDNFENGSAENALAGALRELLPQSDAITFDPRHFVNVYTEAGGHGANLKVLDAVIHVRTPQNGFLEAKRLAVRVLASVVGQQVSVGHWNMDFTYRPEQKFAREGRKDHGIVILSAFMEPNP